MNDLRKLQLKELEIAQHFVDFCQSHDLLCYFCGGGCIGAVRHQGFIPWDDDLDFFLPRDSYEKLKRLWNNDENAPYRLVFSTESYNDHNIFITVRDTSTTMIKDYQADMDIPHGIAIDVFPLDGCPSSGIKRRSQLFWALIYQLYGAQIVPEHHGTAVKTVGALLLGLVRSRHFRYRIWRFAEKKMSRYPIADCQYITELCAGPKYMRLQYPKGIFDSAIMVTFEDTKMPIPVGYDRYLRMAFGDYMQLPPEDQRKTGHEAILIDTEKPYTAYLHQ